MSSWFAVPGRCPSCMMPISTGGCVQPKCAKSVFRPRIFTIPAVSAGTVIVINPVIVSTRVFQP